MKKMLSLLLVFTLVLSMATSAFAAEGTDCGEQPQDQEDQTAPTVSTLEELQAAIAAAKDGDTIAISEEITLDAVTLETNKRIVIIRSDTYPSGTLIRLYNGAKISGFIFEEPTDSTIICVSSWETAIEISLGILTMTDDPRDGTGYYEESTGEKIVLPLTDYASTAKLIFLTDEQAAEYFAPEEPDNPDEEPDTPETPSEPPEQPDNGEDGDAPIEPEESPTTPEGPQDKPDSSDDDYEPPVYRPVRPTKPVEPEPQPAPSLICNNAVIDTSRSAKLQGYGDGLLHEDDSLSRAQMATIVYRLLDDESVAALSVPSSSFTDVDASAWYAPFVLTLADAGVVGGTGNGYFAPDSPTTWVQLLTVLGRFVERQECALQHIRYDGWARPAIETAVALGWIEDSAEIVPDDVITRGEAVELINMVLKQYR